MPVRDLRCLLDIFHDSEKVRRLDDYRRGLIRRFCFRDPRYRALPISVVIEFVHRHALVPRVGEQNFAILRMHGARNQDLDRGR